MTSSSAAPSTARSSSWPPRRLRSRPPSGYYGSDDVTFNGFYLVDGSPIKSAQDLIGKKIGMNTLGAHPEAVTKTYLARAGLTDAEIRTTGISIGRLWSLHLGERFSFGGVLTGFVPQFGK